MTETTHTPMPPALAAIVEGAGWETGPSGLTFYYDALSWCSVVVDACDCGWGWAYFVMTHPESAVESVEIRALAKLTIALDEALRIGGER